MCTVQGLMHMRYYNRIHHIWYSFFFLICHVCVYIFAVFFYYFVAFSLSFPCSLYLLFVRHLLCVWYYIEIHSDILVYEIIIHVFFIGNYFGFNVLKLRFKLFNNCCVHFDTFQSCSSSSFVSVQPIIVLIDLLRAQLFFYSLHHPLFSSCYKTLCVPSIFALAHCHLMATVIRFDERSKTRALVTQINT